VPKRDKPGQVVHALLFQLVILQSRDVSTLQASHDGQSAVGDLGSFGFGLCFGGSDVVRLHSFYELRKNHATGNKDARCRSKEGIE
jgi:hypothetical protein